MPIDSFDQYVSRVYQGSDPLEEAVTGNVDVKVVEPKGKVLDKAVVRVFYDGYIDAYSFADEHDKIYEDDPVYPTAQDAVDSIIDYANDIGDNIRGCNLVAVSKFKKVPYNGDDQVVGEITITWCHVDE